ncbi:copper resistance CopC family protein [Pseudokineococcus sp. 1T1Z-3]|uniref:copper resistance CopC family protein n=1 Tax=Pseudokineococcus sp. 1T1Z-3 TaxID=3132745 RepID=UPI0030962D0D
MTTPTTPTRTARRAGLAAPAAAVLALLAGLLLVGAPSASAHDRLVGSDPEAGAVLDAAPSQVVLTFSAEVQEIGTVLALQDAGGDVVAEAQTAVEGRDVVLPVTTDLASGEYRVVYRVTSSDGHPISGEVPFSVDTADAAVPTTEPAPAPTEPGSASPTEEATPSATPTPTQSGATVEETEQTAAGGDVPWLPVVLVVAAALVAGAVVAAVLSRRRRPGR